MICKHKYSTSFHNLSPGLPSGTFLRIEPRGYIYQAQYTSHVTFTRLHGTRWHTDRATHGSTRFEKSDRGQHGSTSTIRIPATSRQNISRSCRSHCKESRRHSKRRIQANFCQQPAKSLNTAICEDLSQNLYGNPHSEHGPSKLAGKRVEETRLKALEFFNADPNDWDLIFTQNTTAAVKLVHDCFRDYAASPGGRNWWYGYHKDCHTSVVGVREGTRTHRCFRSDREVDLWIESRGLGGAIKHDIGLFAYPAQSNMTGRRLPLDW